MYTRKKKRRKRSLKKTRCLREAMKAPGVSGKIRESLIVKINQIQKFRALITQFRRQL